MAIRIFIDASVKIGLRQKSLQQEGAGLVLSDFSCQGMFLGLLNAKKPRGGAVFCYIFFLDKYWSYWSDLNRRPAHYE